MKNIIITVIGTGIQMIFEISFYRKLIMKEEKLKQELTKKFVKKKMTIDSFWAELVLLVAVIATAILAIFLLFGGKMEFGIKCPPHNWQSGTFSSGCHYCGRRYGGGMFYKCKKCGITEYSGNTTVHCSCEGALNSRRGDYDASPRVNNVWD